VITLGISALEEPKHVIAEALVFVPLILQNYATVRWLSGSWLTKSSFVGFEIFTAVTELDVAPWSVSKRLTVFLLVYFFYSEDGDDTFLRNVGSYKIHTAQHPTLRHSSSLVLAAAL
jgi:hypothetical protein